MQSLQDKRIEFFEDFEEDSFASDSADEELVSDIIQMDVQEVKVIRNYVEKEKIDESTAQEYVIKMKNFLNHKPSTLSKQLNEEFNQQRIWAKHFLSSYHMYVRNNQSQNDQHVSPFSSSKIQLNGSLDEVKDEEIPKHVFNKKRTMTKENNPEPPSHHKIEVEEVKKKQLEIKNVQQSKYPIAQSRYQHSFPRPPHSPVRSPIHQQNQPNFILNTSQMNQIVSRKSENSPQSRPKIFEGKSRNSRFTYTNEQQPDLVVIKHTKPKEEEPMIPFQSPSDNKRVESPRHQEMLSGERMKSLSKKLSDYTEEKKQRKRMAPLEDLSPIEPYVFKPYSQNFNYIQSFSRFRRNCLEDNFTLYASSILLVSCVIKRQPTGIIKIEILYANQSKSDLIVETLYRIPKCFKIQKLTKITKKFVLKDYVHHIYTLQMTSFPLEPCLLNLKYRQINSVEMNQRPTIVSMPITLRNFIQCLFVNKDEWKQYWSRWSQTGYNYRIIKHVLLDKSVLSGNEIEEGLHEFVNVGPVEGYSIDEFGGYCQHSSFPNLTFLIRISIRVDNIISIELLTDRRVNKLDDEKDFLEYCLDNWAMLLGRVEHEDLQ